MSQYQPKWQIIYLLSPEVLHAGTSSQLRQLRRIAEGIRKPECLAPFTKMAFEEPLALEKLSDERFARGIVTIELDPRLSEVSRDWE